MLKLHSWAAAIAAALFICAATTIPSLANAAAIFSVSPLKLTLPADKLATAVTIGNQGATPVTVQSELLGWSQDNGSDALGGATGLIVSPPIFTLAPGAKQVVRVGRVKRGAAPARELAFRLKLAEVRRTDGDGAAVATVIQLSLPVFVPPADRNARPALQVAVVADTGADLKLALTNPGIVHDKVVKMALLRDGKLLVEKPLNFYVLAGAQRELAWEGALASGAAGLELELTLDGGRRTLRQSLAPPPPPPPPPKQD
ncbi:MAG TPA: fimbria/pilus periplasmic chaperone [Verrucomicrobiae bacterium]|nr:fimbria/pilus periplasmic chaperone [Verrucomicrobiae bacterium]